MTDPSPRTGPAVFLVLLVMAAVIAVAAAVADEGGAAPPLRRERPAGVPTPVLPPAGRPAAASTLTPPTPAGSTEPASSAPGRVGRRLPGGRQRVFAGGRLLVAYYGTAQTGALGVLGETPPEQMQRRLVRAAQPFRRPGRPVQLVYELIATIADRSPGPDGDYSHDIPRAEVSRYLRAARRHGALLLLDLQPGRSGFLSVAKRWEWALRDPYVGLALDPEWRMGPRGVPARAIGSVSAAEVNRTSAWLSRLAVQQRLPEKLFVLHQFRASMLPDIDRVVDRPRLATVQHADGFGTRAEKMETFRAIIRPRRFILGMKLFYDEDVRRFTARDVLAIRPRVRFVSFQ